MSPAVSTLTTVFLSALLMLAGLGGAATSDLQVEKSIHSVKTLLCRDDVRRTVRKEPHQQIKNEIRRRVDLESFNIHVSPTTSKISVPTMIKLYPPTTKPLHLYANMPMRFGRENIDGDDKAPNSTPNMPQRFGRSCKVIQMCAECPDVQEAPDPLLPQRYGRTRPHWSLLRTLANAHLLNTGLHWTEDFDFTTSSEEVEMQEDTFKG